MTFRVGFDIGANARFQSLSSVLVSALEGGSKLGFTGGLGPGSDLEIKSELGLRFSS